MKLSTRGRYGVRLMLDLALRQGNGPVLLREIAQRQEISEKYLWQLINPLKAAGLIKSIRGAHGGYLLAKKPEEVNLKQILSVLEGPLCLVDCVEQPSACDRSPSCIAHDVWAGAAQGIVTVLEAMTLDKMVEGHLKKTDSFAGYSI
jgi:Rrf2 family transcriptional regulator, cysteine metabolism repressor